MDPRDAFLERAKAGGGGIVPVIREIVTDADTPVAAFAKIARPPFAFLLESLVGGERWARYTFLGTEPREVWRCQAGGKGRGRTTHRWTQSRGREGGGGTDEPIGAPGAAIGAPPAVRGPGLPRLPGGAGG